ncbi:MAG: hypothetical protein QM660_13390 [Dysgonomonas sp.]
MITVNLGNLNGIPNVFLKKLEKFDSLFYQNNFLENFWDKESINDIIITINEYCESNTILGIHYTKTVPEEIFKTGLTCRSGEEIRDTFMINYGYLFTEDEKGKIIESWDDYFNLGLQKIEIIVYFSTLQLMLYVMVV